MFAMSWRLSGLAIFAALLLSAQVHAGQTCDKTPASPQKIAAAAETALMVEAALEQRDAPVAVLARVGTDLSKHGLVYSHAGFVMRDHTDGRWTIVHLLNECGTARSGLHAQGLVNFFADELVNQDARIVWLEPALAQTLATRLNAMPRYSLLQPHYNIIARPGSRDTQNSTAWMLEVLASATLPSDATPDRASSYQRALQQGFQPDVLQIPYSQRILGGMFSANAEFTDHPVATRLQGRYPVVTVRSIFSYMQRAGLAAAEMEWRHGKLLTAPGPG